MKNRSLIQLDTSLSGPFFMLSAALLYTLLNILIKLLRPEFTVWHIGFFRFFGGLVILISIFGHKGNPYKGHNVRLLIFRGCAGSIAFFSLITAVRLLPISTAIVIFYAYPAFSAIFSFLIYGERIGIAETLCIAGVVGGVAILFDFQVSGGIFGQTMAVVSSVFAGLTVTLIRNLRQYNGPVIIYLYLCTMASMVTLPVFIMNPILPVNPLEWIMVLGIIFFAVAAQLLMNQGFFYCRAWEGGVFMSTEVIFTAVAGIVFMNDPATLQFWIGGLIIFGSGLVLNRLKTAEK